MIAKADDATLEATLQEANEVIAGVNAATIPPRDSNPAFVSAYYYKPKGQALSCVSLTFCATPLLIFATESQVKGYV